MNKRIAKKKYKEALDVMKTSRETGVGVTIVNHCIVDKNGKPCNPQDKGSRFITLKRPKIQYTKPAKEKD